MADKTSAWGRPATSGAQAGERAAWVYVVLRLGIGLRDEGVSRKDRLHAETTVSVEKVFRSRREAEAEVTRLNSRNASGQCRYLWQSASLAAGGGQNSSRVDGVIEQVPVSTERDVRWQWLRPGSARIKMNAGLAARVTLMRASAALRRYATATGQWASERWHGEARQKTWAATAAGATRAGVLLARVTRHLATRSATFAAAHARAVHGFWQERPLERSWTWLRSNGSRLRKAVDFKWRPREKKHRERPKTAENGAALAPVAMNPPARTVFPSWLIAHSEFKRLGRSWFTRVSITVVASAIKRHAKACGYEVTVNWFGAYDTDPGQLVFWLWAASDDEKKQIERDGEFWEKLRSFLVQYRYPEEGRAGVFFGVESKEALGAKPGPEVFSVREPVRAHPVIGDGKIPLKQAAPDAAAGRAVHLGPP
jgi:hypothetical protein